MTRGKSQNIRRRKVFYLPGYDPFPPRRYRELYRTESAKQAAISGYEISLTGPLTGRGYGWQVLAEIDGKAVQSEVQVLGWSDIARASYKGPVWQTYAALLSTGRIYLSSGAFWRIIRLRKGPAIAALYPVAMLLAQLLVALLAGVAGALLLQWSLGMALPSTQAHWVLWPLSAVIFVLLARGVLRWFRDNDGRFLAYYLMHDFAHSAALHGAYSDALEARLHDFREHVWEALHADLDEVLVVGHSSGAHLAVSMLADILRTRGLPETGPALSLLSLGHVVPMVSFLPHAERLRGDLRYLSCARDVTWVDVTAPGDGCCFALCDPVAVSGQSTKHKRGPLVISAAFSQTLSATRWRRLRWRFFRLHFQYLCAFDQPGDYDYFQITAGPQSLAARFADRKPSPSRQERAVSKYTSVRP